MTVDHNLTIGYIGNFAIHYTTENERKWSLEKLGHKVIPFQENQTTAKDLMEAMGDLDLLLYSHTHDPSWEIEFLPEVLLDYAKTKTPTASVHLDVFAGLHREKDVDTESMWKCEYVFTADGSPEAAELYDRKGINWHWLKPGVVERDCYYGTPDRDRFPHDVIFVGSHHYHEEWPHRPRLIDWLKKTYGKRFGHYGKDGLNTIRGKALNDLYASAKVVVGDSCFAGQRANYWSDRIAETTGRGGFLLFPEIEGLDHKGVPLYRTGDYVQLYELIDWFLAADEERERKRKEAHEWTKNNRTYTQLSQEMLDVIFGGK